MRTNFSEDRLAEPGVAAAAKAVRACVSCGFCVSGCPTFVLTGDERDGPRGRIKLMQAMLEQGGAPDPVAVRHVDRCLSCLACASACPSGVDYARLVDAARAHIERHHPRGFADVWLRRTLAFVLPRPWAFRAALALAPLARRLPLRWPKEWAAMFALTPASLPRVVRARGRAHAAKGETVKRVALLPGCVQSVLAPQIHEAALRVLTRHGVEVVVPERAPCCGALAHHLGKERGSKASAAATLTALLPDLDRIDAVVTTASGCGVVVQDYARLFAGDPALAAPAAKAAALAQDVTALLAALPLRKAAGPRPAIVVQAPCSLQHGLRKPGAGEALLAGLGFPVATPADGHLCCGSAGVYNILQPEMAEELRTRKIAALRGVGARIVASGNIGCMTQLARGTDLVLVHTVELADWATGGPRPISLEGIA